MEPGAWLSNGFHSDIWYAEYRTTEISAWYRFVSVYAYKFHYFAITAYQNWSNRPLATKSAIFIIILTSFNSILAYAGRYFPILSFGSWMTVSTWNLNEGNLEENSLNVVFESTFWSRNIWLFNTKPKNIQNSAEGRLILLYKS